MLVILISPLVADSSGCARCIATMNNLGTLFKTMLKYNKYVSYKIFISS